MSRNSWTLHKDSDKPHKCIPQKTQPQRIPCLTCPRLDRKNPTAPLQPLCVRWGWWRENWNRMVQVTLEDYSSNISHSYILWKHNSDIKILLSNSQDCAGERAWHNYIRLIINLILRGDLGKTFSWAWKTKRFLKWCTKKTSATFVMSPLCVPKVHWTLIMRKHQPNLNQGLFYKVIDLHLSKISMPWDIKLCVRQDFLLL